MSFPLTFLDGLLKLCVSVGATAVSAGTISSSGLTDPSVAQTMAGTALAGLLRNKIGSEVATDASKKLVELLSEGALSRSIAAVRAQLAGAQTGADLPANHDLLRAVRTAGLLGLQHCLWHCREDIQRHRDAEVYDDQTGLQLKRLERWLSKEIKSCERNDYFESALAGPEPQDLVERTPDYTIGSTGAWSQSLEAVAARIKEAPGHGRSGDLFLQLFDEAEVAVFAEMQAVLHQARLGELTQALTDWVLGYNTLAPQDGETYAPGWRIAAAAFFADQVKSNERLSTVVFNLRLDGLASQLKVVIKMAGELGDRLLALERQMGELHQQMSQDLLPRLDTLLELARGSSPEVIVEQLRMAFPPGQYWSRTATQVRRRVEELRRSFVGRNTELAELDAFIAKQRRGLVVVAAPSGVGKSAFMAAWVDRRLRAGDRVVRHFISNRMDATSLDTQVFGHLLIQMSHVPGSTGEWLEGADALNQRLHHLSASIEPPNTRKLIIVIDGLDEARSAVMPFVEEDLADGVYVVVSCRAEAGSTPKVLAPWEERRTLVQFQRLDLKRLNQIDVLAWLSEIDLVLTQQEAERLAADLWRAADGGIALFLSYLLKDLEHAEARDRWLCCAGASMRSMLPKAFDDYVREQFQMLKGEKLWTKWHKRFMAMLCVALGPLSEAELESDALLDDGVGAAINDHRLGRWLSIEQDAGIGFRVALAHPFLAGPIGRCLGDDALAKTENDLIEWAKKEAKSSSPPAYVLDWFPRHLSAVDPDATALWLLDPDFLLARLRDPVLAGARLSQSMIDWHLLGLTHRLALRAREWTAFWAENEAPLRSAIQPLSAACPPLDIVRDCLGDAMVLRSDSTRFPPLAKAGHQPPFGMLLRSLPNAHGGLFGVQGLLDIGEALASWGSDGAIRFWTKAGERLESQGIDHAHEGRIDGLLDIGEALVSWGDDYAIRFWTKAGERLEDRVAENAHGGCIRGLLDIGEALVSWGADYAIRFWTKAGERMDDRGEDHVHKGGIGGVLDIGEALASWSYDGTIRFWTKAGGRLEDRVAEHAHGREIFGVLDIGEALVSWGGDGAMRFWTKEGERMKGQGAEHAHENGVHGVLDIGESLVSWGGDGAIRFWTKEGRRLESRESDRAHEDWIGGVIDIGEALVSWGGDGAIRFWTKMGERLKELGTEHAHEGRIGGVLDIGEALVSWDNNGEIRFWMKAGEWVKGLDARRSYDTWIDGALDIGRTLVSWDSYGAIHFWSKTGERLEGWGTEHAHEGRIGGLLDIGEALVSWGSDGEMRFWTKSGELLKDGGPDHAHTEGICGVLDIGEALASWSYDGAIRFWTKEGEPLSDLGADHEGSLSGVLDIGEKLVSWGGNSVIRFWTKTGERQLGWGDDQAHRDGILGMLDIGDALISWGNDGAIHFWTKTGKRLEGRSVEHAHDDGVLGVLDLGETLVSWGKDGAIHFWTKTGKRLEGWGVEHAHHDGVLGVMDLGETLVSWGKDGAIHFWTKTGKRLEERGAAHAHSFGVATVRRTAGAVVSVGVLGDWKLWRCDGEFIRALVVPGGARPFVADRGNLLLGVGRRIWAYDLARLTGC